VERQISAGSKVPFAFSTEPRAASVFASGHEKTGVAVASAFSGEPQGKGAPRRARLLLVDDEPALARTLKLLLSEAHDVTAVTTGQEALEILLGNDSFDLVLCDLMMPQVTGMDIHTRLVAERPQMAERIVFMTGGAFTARAADFLKRVTNARLEKPFSTDAVETLLRAQWLDAQDDERGI
jgi:CheY-like chemotaxis protein